MMLFGKVCLGLWCAIAAQAVAAEEVGPDDLSKVIELLRAEGVNSKLSESDLYRGAIRGVVKAAAAPDLQAYNKMMTAEELRELLINTSGEVAGIGAVLQIGKGAPDDASNAGPTKPLVVSSDAPLIVRQVLPQSPALSGGLQTGDHIVRIDGKTVAGQGFADTIMQLRGKPGSKVELSVLRQGNMSKLTLKRGKVPIPSVVGGVLPGQVAYVAIQAFTEKTEAQFRGLLDEFSQANVERLVLDFRGNSGGVLSPAMAIGKTLLPKDKLITKIVRRDQSESYLGEGSVLAGLPTVVLVDRQTASAAEILTRALQDHNLALVMGEVTTGKNSVERVDEIDGSGVAIKFTIARWHAPSGMHPVGEGIKPDVPMLMNKHGQSTRYLTKISERIDQDPVLQAAVRVVQR